MNNYFASLFNYYGFPNMYDDVIWYAFVIIVKVLVLKRLRKLWEERKAARALENTLNQI
jgi:hypothetical protein